MLARGAFDRFAQAGATAAMEDNAYFEAMCRKIIASKQRLIADMQARKVTASATPRLTATSSPAPSSAAPYFRRS